MTDPRLSRTDEQPSPSHSMPQGATGDGQAKHVRSAGQEWILTWHGPHQAPDGEPHGSAGICLTRDQNIVLVSDGRLVSEGNAHWYWPAGRPEAGEDWEATLRREIREEACAEILACHLLGFSRAQCINGQEQGLVLVRAFWRADVELRPWDPKFEIRHRRLVSVVDVLSQVTVDEGWLRIYRRALAEAGLR